MASYTAGTSFCTKDNSVWHIVDASGVVLGRLASQVAKILRGKHKPSYTPFSASCSDHVIIINAKDIKLTGSSKPENMKHFWHTGYPGGIKERTASMTLSGKHPERLTIKAIERMMPKESPLARVQMKRLYVYPDASHPHAGQEPKPLDIANKNPKNKR